MSSEILYNVPFLYMYFYIYIYIYIYIYDYLKKTIKRNVAIDKGNSRNET